MVPDKRVQTQNEQRGVTLEGVVLRASHTMTNISPDQPLRCREMDEQAAHFEGDSGSDMVMMFAVL